MQRLQLHPKVSVSVVFVASLFMSIMDTTIVNVALPALGREFHVPSAALDAVVVSYLINLAAYHAAFFAAAVLELIAVGWALTIYDSDAAATLRRPDKQAG